MEAGAETAAHAPASWLVAGAAPAEGFRTRQSEKRKEKTRTWICFERAEGVGENESGAGMLETRAVCYRFMGGRGERGGI
jgi:hypothetical protein